jgi:hypothetical protein
MKELIELRNCFINLRKMFGGELNRMFAIKCLLKIYPFYFITISFLPIVLMSSHLLKVYESPVFLIDTNSQQLLIDFRNFGNCVWCVLITMASVGYGDYYPKTLIGRIISISSAINGTVFVSILIISLQEYLGLTYVERKTVDFVDRLNHKEIMKKKAAKYFLISFKFIIEKQKYMNEFKHKKKLKLIRSKLNSIIYERISQRKAFKNLIQ